MRNIHFKKSRLFCFIFIVIIPFASRALKIDKTHFRFCVMDNAIITDYAASSAESTNQLPVIPSAYWYSYNGIMINGTETYYKNSNAQTSIKILISEPYSGENYAIKHYWVKGINGIGYDQTTYIYIEADFPTGVSIDNLPKRMLVGEEQIISPTLLGDYTPFSGDGYFDYKYSITDEDVVSYSSGKIIAKKMGKTTINVEVYAKNHSYSGSYYIGNASAEIEIVDNMEPNSIELDKNDITLNVGREKFISANLFPEDARTTITWKSSNQNVATVEDGCILGIGRGQCTIEAYTSNGLSAKCNVTVLSEEDYKGTLNIDDINKSWGMTREDVINYQSENYYLYKEEESSVIFSTMVDHDKIFISYRFDSNERLCASTLSIPFNQSNYKFSNDFFFQYSNDDIDVIQGVETKTNGTDIVTIDHSTTLNGGRIITLGFSYYEPLEYRDDCIDLGLSVRWACCNLGASSPTEIGDFYAWSETSTKSGYWEENYAFCNNYSNKYIYEYTNPLTNICKTQYDIANIKLGENWKMPSLAEVNELITLCTWDKDKVDGIEVYRITGPNGNSIIIPIVGKKRKDEEHSTSRLSIAIGEAPSNSDEDCYVISAEYYGNTLKGTIALEWKAWGHNIRPVYTK